MHLYTASAEVRSTRDTARNKCRSRLETARRAAFDFHACFLFVFTACDNLLPPPHLLRHFFLLILTQKCGHPWVYITYMLRRSKMQLFEQALVCCNCLAVLAHSDVVAGAC